MLLFPVLFADETGLEIADRLHDALQGGAHLGLKLAVVGAALLDEALGDGEARLVSGERNAEFSALQFEIGSKAQITAEDAATDCRDDDNGLHEVTQCNVGREMRMQHAEVVGGHRGTFGNSQGTVRQRGGKD